MTARMANPSPRAIARRNTAPIPITRDKKKRGTSAVAPVETKRIYLNTSSAANASLVPVDKPLTEKQKNFVKFWAQGDSVSNSALRAGYAQDSIAYQLVKMPNILALKHKLEAQWESENQMSRKKVMDGMLEAIDMARLMAEPANMIAGWREIGKICGYYAPVEHKVKVDVTGNIVLDKLNALSDAELLKIITDGSKSAPALLEDFSEAADPS